MTCQKFLWLFNSADEHSYHPKISAIKMLTKFRFFFLKHNKISIQKKCNKENLMNLGFKVIEKNLFNEFIFNQ